MQDSAGPLQFAIAQVAAFPYNGSDNQKVGGLCREGRITASEGSASVLDARKTRPQPASPRKGSEP